MSKDATPSEISEAEFSIGDVVRHRIFEFRGVIFDIDPVFDNSEDWYLSIPEAVASGEEPTFLSSVRREWREQLCCLCQPAKLANRSRRRPG